MLSNGKVSRLASAFAGQAHAVRLGQLELDLVGGVKAASKLRHSLDLDVVVRARQLVDACHQLPKASAVTWPLTKFGRVMTSVSLLDEDSLDFAPIQIYPNGP